MEGITKKEVRHCPLADDVGPLDKDLICSDHLVVPHHATFIREIPSQALQEMAPLDKSFRKPRVFRFDPRILKTKLGLDKIQREMLNIPFDWE